MPEGKKTDFEEMESEQGLIGEFWGFLMENKKFWLIPILLVLLFLGFIIVFSPTAAGPVIYTLF